MKSSLKLYWLQFGPLTCWPPLKSIIWRKILECFPQIPSFIFDWRNKDKHLAWRWVNYQETFILEVNFSFNSAYFQPGLSGDITDRFGLGLIKTLGDPIYFHCPVFSCERRPKLRREIRMRRCDVTNSDGPAPLTHCSGRLWVAARRPRDKQVKLHAVMPGTVNLTEQRLSDSNYDIY